MGSLKLTTPDKPLRRRHSNVLVRNQLSPFAGTLSSNTNRPSSTLSKRLRGKTEVRTRSLHEWLKTATPTRHPCVNSPKTDTCARIGNRVMVRQNERFRLPVPGQFRYLVEAWIDRFPRRSVALPAFSPSLAEQT